MLHSLTSESDSVISFRRVADDLTFILSHPKSTGQFDVKDTHDNLLESFLSMFHLLFGFPLPDISVFKSASPFVLEMLSSRLPDVKILPLSFMSSVQYEMESMPWEAAIYHNHSLVAFNSMWWNGSNDYHRAFICIRNALKRCRQRVLPVYLVFCLVSFLSFRKKIGAFRIFLLLRLIHSGILIFVVSVIAYLRTSRKELPLLQ